MFLKGSTAHIVIVGLKVEEFFLRIVTVKIAQSCSQIAWIVFLLQLKTDSSFLIEHIIDSYFLVKMQRFKRWLY